ncbi:MAG: Crp/Fnr family transcriptional regulator [Gemmatimonadaceae bacterium]|nr:Crp/Fnr family transcriptional regulator [Gemmatimonadaceae bacterium]NUQ92448.1 Crp/Fnr family transcriptional regulator [Gemmatimonadaceae bacterium]NUR18068.1 Crp/Fnr family transcriptional regulator [Gemmatimonadaceae bacterium]NUS95789.1 Crp/Fnr family transcriptional regulator [Gemmatimonadaceae bacterium]
MTDSVTPERSTDQNRLLRAMSPEGVDLLRPHLEPVTLELRQVVYDSMAPITHAYFPTDGAISILAAAGSDESVEVGTVGFEGFSGIPLLFGVDREPLLAICQSPVTGWRIAAAELRDAVEHPSVREVLLRYAQAYRIQAGQASACNRSHSLEERCARWLLQMHDRARQHDFILTHDFLAGMLGVRRAGVTVAAGHLQQSGLIRYKRGLVSVLDRAGLEAAACQCYRIVNDSYDALFPAEQAATPSEALAGQ